MPDSILEIGEAGLETTDEKVKNLVNRMVNAETPAFKGSDITVRSFPLELQAAEQRLQSQKPQIDGTFYNHIQGALIRTGKTMDLAIGASGFFVVLCPWGEGYTRDGRFTVDKEGKVATTVGNYPLLGNNGPVVVNPLSKIAISETGEIKADAVFVDKIRIIDLDNKQALESVNGVIFKDSGQQASMKEVENPRIIQGYIEASNVKIVDQMIDLVYLSRLYNLDTKIISVREASLSRALEIGRNQ